MKCICPVEKDGSTTSCKAAKKNGKIKGCDRESGEDNEEELGDEEKMILIHYEQRKVMQSQLHPIEVPDTDPPSELREVQTQVTRQMKELVAISTLTRGSPGLPDGGPQPTSLLPGQI